MLGSVISATAADIGSTILFALAFFRGAFSLNKPAPFNILIFSAFEIELPSSNIKKQRMK
jgi:hypothetical protein